MDGLIGFAIVGVVGGAILIGIINVVVRLGGGALRTKFIKLGDLRGKTSGQIIARVGQPQSRSQIEADSTLLQWMATGYHISLIFKDDICQGVHHESVR